MHWETIDGMEVLQYDVMNLTREMIRRKEKWIMKKRKGRGNWDQWTGLSITSKLVQFQEDRGSKSIGICSNKFNSWNPEKKTEKIMEDGKEMGNYDKWRSLDMTNNVMLWETRDGMKVLEYEVMNLTHEMVRRK